MNNTNFLIDRVKSGGNPKAILAQMAEADPRINAFLSMVNGRPEQQLRYMAQNIAKDKGVDLDAFVRDMTAKVQQTFGRR